MPDGQASSGSSAEYIALSLPSDPKYLGLLRTVVGRAADLYGFSEEEKHGLMLAVNEGCANIIEHCYHMDSRQKIDVTIRILPDRMIVDLRDYGKFSGVADKDAPDEPACEDLKPGGLGCVIMQRVMDEVQYLPAERKGTLLSMVKYRVPRKT